MSKCLKVYVDFKNAIKVAENGFGFDDNCFGTFSGNFSQLWQEYIWSDINVLKDDPNISDPTNRHDTQLNLFDINGKLV